MPFIDTPETNALKSKVEKLLSEIPDFTDENKNLKINVIKDYADNGNVKLLEPLLKNTQTKKAFFTPILDSFVFNTAKFKEFLEYSSACNSYSKYLGEKIGLYMGDSSLLDRNEVVLNFPFKDCVLEGGQRKEDGLDTYYEYNDKKDEYEEKQSKRREVFYNEVLAQDEIDSLFSPKAFCNTKRYEKGKSEKCTKLNRDAELNKKRGLAEDTITDNLIIKGNNLLALHSLKKEFAGKVKLIYIDVPYNTGSDSFSYNDNFNHSSWLTFMKNRLEIARDLLRDDGCIFVQCDDNEQAYLKVLMDEIFVRENKLSTITVKVKAPAGVGQESFLFDVNEYILVFAKNINLVDVNIIKEQSDLQNNTYTQYKKIIHNIADGKYVKKLHSEKVGDIELLEHNLFEVKNIDKENLNESFYSNNIDKIFRTTNPQGGLLNKLLPHIPKKGLFSITYKPTKGKKKEDKITYYFLDGSLILWLSDSAILENGKIKKLNKMTNSWTDNFFQGISNEGGVTLLGGKKPEFLIKRILDLSTSDSDIILDYHLGSGTTAAVAHKMNRQYIGIEQLDYGENDSVVRLQNVINGDQTGISKSVNWQGGGSFVYLELAKKNETALEQISACKSLEELTELFDELCSKYFLHYNVRVKEFRKEIESERFKQLKLKQQKEMFSRMLDLNQLYVNTDDRHDINTGLTKDDIAITEDFYQLK